MQQPSAGGGGGGSSILTICYLPKMRFSIGLAIRYTSAAAPIPSSIPTSPPDVASGPAMSFAIGPRNH